MLKFINTAASILLLLSLLGCQEYAFQEIVDKPSTVNLLISIATLDQRSDQSSRADEAVPNETTYFEDAINQYELMSSIRIIIVNPSNQVEKNVYIDLNSPHAVDHVNDISIPVTGGQTKQIILIANEASIDYDFAALVDGSNYSENEINDILLTASSAGQPIIDNSGSSKKYLPMTETYSVYVDEPDDLENDDVYTQEEEFFITRTTVKFSFEFISPASSTEYSQGTVYLTDVTFKRISSTQYLMPRNLTYSPDKNIEYNGGRLITSYDTPDIAEFADIDFILPDGGLLITPGMDKKWAPELYYPETKVEETPQKYYVTATLMDKSSGKSITFGDVELPNLPSLPRNTHVIIKMTFENSAPICEVDVLPYTGVYLNPIFGIDRDGDTTDEQNTNNQN